MTAPRERQVTERIRCSFCNKEQRNVRKIIAGPKVSICDECVDICVDIIAEDEEAQSAFSTFSPGNAAAVNCSLCEMSTAVDQCVVIPDRGPLCRVCIDIIRLATDPDNEVEGGGAT